MTNMDSFKKGESKEVLKNPDVLAALKISLAKKKQELLDLQKTIKDLKIEMIKTEGFIGRKEDYDDSVHVQSLDEKTKLMNSLVEQRLKLEDEIRQSSEELSGLEFQAAKAGVNIFSESPDLSMGYVPNKDLPLQ